jgi:nucleoside-diphosphate-sugar epimerase
MKIAVLGANGFVGSNLVSHLLCNHLVTMVTRQTVNLLNPAAVKQFLEIQQFDIVINAAAIMTDKTVLADTRNNLGIFMNFYNNSHLFKKFINLASGAEYDRATNIDCVDESEIFNRLPADSYGFGQNIKSRLSVEKPGFYNLRIFNCFGPGEIQTRIFPKLLKSKTKFEITDDRYFDYFSIRDLCRVVDSFVTEDHVVYDVNCVYKDKHKISQAAELFAAVKQLKREIIVTSTSENNYTGSHINLYSLNLRLDGLEKGFKEYV